MAHDGKHRSFLISIRSYRADLLKDIASSVLVVVLTFLLATIVSAGLLWFYEWPLFLAPLGGFVVLGVMLAPGYDG